MSMSGGGGGGGGPGGPPPMMGGQQQHQQILGGGGGGGGVGVMGQQMGGPSPHPPQQGQGQGPPPGAMIPHPSQQQGGGGHPGQQQGHPGHPQQQQGQGQQQLHSGDQGRMDNISKAKSLVAPIKDTLSNVLRTAASAIYANNMVDSGSKPVDFDVSRFDRTLEEFFTLCDQMEVHLKTSIECINQGMCSQRYLQTPVALSRVDGLTYPQYIRLVKGQIAYAKEVHGTLAEASLKLTE